MRRGALIPTLLAAALAGCGGSHDATTTRAAQPTGPCTVAPAAGDVQLDAPEAIIHVPPGLEAGRHVPLVLGIHGAGENAAKFQAFTSLDASADAHGFIVVYAQSPHPRGFWKQDGADVQQLRDTVAAVQERYCIDDGRILATGHSSGGRMTYTVACRMADVLLAAAPVSAGTRFLPRCEPSRPVSILDIHATGDTVVSYRGVGPKYDRSVPEVVKALSLAMGCTGRRTDRRTQPGILRMAWHNCPAPIHVEHLQVAGQNHPWHRFTRSGVRWDDTTAIVGWFTRLPSR